MSHAQGDAAAHGNEPTCVRHPGRTTQLQCVRCGRPACPECLREAPVGYQCVDCVRQGAANVRRPRTVAGAPIRSGRPVVTLTLIVINALLYVYTAYDAQSVMNNSQSVAFVRLHLVPALIAGNGEWWRLFTGGFLHFGLLHIALNMVALYIVGREVEVVLGRLRFTALYVVSLFGGGIAVFLFAPVASPVAGASGAVFGLFGALAIAVFRLKLNARSVMMVIGLNLVISFTIPGVSWQGHIGGLIVGVLAMLGMMYAPAKHRTLVQLGTLLTLVALLIALYFVRDGMLSLSVLCQQTGVQC